MLKEPKPKDNKTWWIASHCADGTLDGNKDCGYCGKIYIECAREMSEAIKRSITENEVKHCYALECGASGFWCPNCGRFWAQDVCSESVEEPWASDDAKCYTDDAKLLHCICGQKLYMIGEDGF